MTEQKKHWTKDEPTANQTVVAQKMVLTIPKNSRIVRKDIAMVFHNVTKTSVLRNFSSDGEKERPTIEIVVSNLNDPNKTETMRWTGGEEGTKIYRYLFHLS
jgi:hypothetical protein